MSVRPYRDIHRRKCRQIHVGKVPVGGDAPITVQTMTNTLTPDVKATVAQIKAAEEAGADIVRVSCPDQESDRKSTRLNSSHSSISYAVFCLKKKKKKKTKKHIRRTHIEKK